VTGGPDREAGLLDRVASFGWRYLIVIASVAVTFYAIGVIKVVVIPATLAFFTASVLSPPVQWLKRRGWSPLRATWTGIGLVVPVVVLLVLLVGPALSTGFQPLVDDFQSTTDSVVKWLSTGPLSLSESQIQSFIDQAVTAFRSNLGGLTSGLVGGATVAIEVVTGVILTLLATFFYLKDGDRAYAALLRRVSRQDRLHAQLSAAWSTLSSYMRGLVIVGLVDATFIAAGLIVVGAPLVLPLAVLVFFGGFFPIIGAFLSGLLAVSVAFANGGVTDAIVVFVIVLVVQQVEGHVLYPIVFRRVLLLHPLVIVLAIASGGVAFGIIGAFLAVPLTAMAVAAYQAGSADPDHSVVALLRSPLYDEGDPLADAD